MLELDRAVFCPFQLVQLFDYLGAGMAQCQAARLGAQASGLREFRQLAETGAALFAER